MTSDWTTLPLDQCLDALIDYRGKTPEKSAAGIPLVTARVIKSGRIETPTEFIPVGNYDAWMRRGLPKSGDVLLTVEAPLGEVAQVGQERIALAQRVVALRGKSGVLDNSYLLYLLQSQGVQDQLKARATGTTVLGIKQSELRQVQLSFPPHGCQVAIAEFLGLLDDRIALLRETNATLDAMARGLFKSWFVDFEPVRANLAGRPTYGMHDQTAKLFPAALSQSPSGEVPNGWKTGTLGHLASLNPEAWTARNHPDRIAYVDLSNTKENEMDLVAEISFARAPSRARRVLRQGDTIVGTVRPGNRSFAFINAPQENLTASTGFAVLRPAAPEYAAFVFLAATCEASIEHLAHIADGGAYPAVRPEAVSSLQCVLPGKSVLKAFQELVDPLLAEISLNQKQCQTLGAIRQILLPRLISGKLRLPEAAERIADGTRS